jgi:isocitrate/isopropylmalate dehydrogenase
VTVCDKANILRSYAFFRAVCDEVAAGYPDVAIDYAYADAITVHMLKKPDFYDVIVAENMFGDIISDLGAGTVGGLGIAPRPSSAMRTACSRARMARRPTSPGRTWPARWPPSCRAR